MKFYAFPAYTGVFKEALDERVAIINKLGRGIGSGGCSCGMCPGEQGYKFILPDGKQGFFCGHDVIPLPTFRADNMPEIKDALKMQDDFYMNQILKKNIY